MSLSEILVVLLIAFMVMKPEDIYVIIKRIQQFKNSFIDIKNKILFSFTEELNIDNKIDEDFEELNFYLQKIIDIEGKYDGDYSIEKIKIKYHELINSKVKNHKSKDLI